MVYRHHIFGFIAVFSMVAVGGSVVFLERLPPSQKEIDYALRANNVTIMAAPPIILEEMKPFLQNSNDFSAVQRLKYFIYGGVHLKEECGGWFHSHGVNIRATYGTLEGGNVLYADMDPKNKSWESLGLYHKDENGSFYGVFEYIDSDDETASLKHLYTRANSPTMASNVVNRPDGGFSTDDVFRPDPNCPGRYIYVSRRDNIIALQNGEKLNPHIIEGIIRSHDIVKQVVALGRDRQCIAALIEINEHYAKNWDWNEIEKAVNAAIKYANEQSSNYATILPQMVYILKEDQHLTITDKGNIIRKRAAADYKNVVDKMYVDLLNGLNISSKLDISVDTPEQIDAILVASASKVLNLPESAFEDRSQSLFNVGLNSLYALQLRSYIAEYFDDIPQGFLFHYSSIQSIREVLMKKKQNLDTDLYQKSQNLALSYIEKAKIDFPDVALNNYNNNTEKVILLTGATGSLGSFILVDLLKDISVQKIYVCIRGDEEDLQDRLVDAFHRQSLDIHLLKTERLEILPMRFSEPWLGFDQKRYHCLQNEVTIIQHCAWLLDLNMPIDHYDKECIAPFYNLLKFAYKQENPMHVHFISSVSAAANNANKDNQVSEEPLPMDAHIAMDMGYGQSKFIVEILLNYLKIEKNIPCYIERLGQICGDSVNGVWKTNEQFCLMFIGGGAIMHKMPDLDDCHIDWIPVDYASASIVDIMLYTAHLSADDDGEHFLFNIVNPNAITWTNVLEAMQQSGMKFDLVALDEWLQCLEKDDSNPAYPLLSFYGNNFKNASKLPSWKTRKACAISPLLSKSPVINNELFSKYLNHWKSIGFYRSLK